MAKQQLPEDLKIGDVIAAVRPRAVSPMRWPRWHVVQCVGQSDNHVLEWMKRCNFVTYYPIVQEMRKVPLRKLSHAQRKSGFDIMKPVDAPIFPRYVFVMFDMKNDEWRASFQIAGATGLVCAGGLPVQVPDALIAKLKGQEVEGVIPGNLPPDLIFEQGELVRVVDGAFVGHNGPVEERLSISRLDGIDSDTRIKVLINILGRAVSVPLEIAQVSKI